VSEFLRDCEAGAFDWVVALDAIYEHTEPSDAGYLKRAIFRRGTRLPVAYAGTEVAVDDLLGPAEADS
jgi:hypothetical protein